MESSLEDVLSGKPVVEPEPAEEETKATEPEEVEVVEVEDDEVADEPIEAKGEEKTEPPAVKAPKDVPLTALLDERDKRKAVQAELEKLRTERAEPSEKPDFWADPEKAIEAQVTAHTQKLEQQFTNGYLSLSMAMSSKFHDDFDTAKEAFARAAEENPSLAQMALQSEMPGEYIYNTGKQFMELDSVGGDVNSLREKIRLEERAKLEAEFKSKASKLSNIPTPITETASASSPREKVEGGVTPLENLFKHNSG